MVSVRGDFGILEWFWILELAFACILEWLWNPGMALEWFWNIGMALDLGMALESLNGFGTNLESNLGPQTRKSPA